MLQDSPSLLTIMFDNILVTMIRKYTHKFFQGPHYRISLFTVLVNNTAKHKRHKSLSEGKYMAAREGKHLKTREGFEENVFL